MEKIATICNQISDDDFAAIADLVYFFGPTESLHELTRRFERTFKNDMTTAYAIIYGVLVGQLMANEEFANYKSNITDLWQRQN